MMEKSPVWPDCEPGVPVIGRPRVKAAIEPGWVRFFWIQTVSRISQPPEETGTVIRVYLAWKKN